MLRAIAVDDAGPGVAAGAADLWLLPALVLDHGGAAVRDVLNELAAASLTIDQLAGRCDLPVARVAAAVSRPGGGGSGPSGRGREVPVAQGLSRRRQEGERRELKC